jgi:hypothetical protein
VFPSESALADAESEALAEAAVSLALAKRSYSSWVRSCFQSPSSRTNRVKRSELEPSGRLTVNLCRRIVHHVD